MHSISDRLLSVMQSDLDIQLMLETKCNYVEKLRHAQAEMENEGIIIVDQLTVARNYVLINAELIGGIHEKYNPAWTWNEHSSALLHSVPLFAGSMVLPDVYTIPVNYRGLNNTKIGEY
jgi:hypothetical protein